MVSKRAAPAPQQEQETEQAAAGANSNSSRLLGARGRRYKGVRMRSWGKWVSEIRLPNTRDRLWLGSYSTPEQAARAFDVAVICLRGSTGATNFPNDPPPYAPRGLSLPQIQQLAAAHAAAHAPSATPLSLSFSFSSSAPPQLLNNAPNPCSSFSHSHSLDFSPSSPSSSSSSESSLSSPPSSPHNTSSHFRFSHDLLLLSLLDLPPHDPPSPSPPPHHIDWDSLSLPDPFLLPPPPVSYDDEFYVPSLWNL